MFDVHLIHHSDVMPIDKINWQRHSVRLVFNRVNLAITEMDVLHRVPHLHNDSQQNV